MSNTNAKQGRRIRVGWPGLTTNLALFAGLVVAAGLPPYPWTGILVPVGMALLFGVLVSSERPGRTAWFFGLAHQTVLLHWLFLLVPSKTIPTRALVPIQASAAILYVSCFYLVTGWVFGKLRNRLGPVPALLLLPVLWTGMEVLRSRGELAFSWCLSGAAVVGTPLMTLAKTSGEIGVGAGLAFVAAVLTLVHMCRRGASVPTLYRNVLLIACGLVWVFLAVGSRVRPVVPVSGPDTMDSIEVAAVQADVSLAVKWMDSKIDSTKIPYTELTRQASADGAEFVVWAETAVPAYLRYDKPLLSWARTLVKDTGVWLFAGFPDAARGGDGKVRTYNSSGLFSPDGQIQDRYAKYHLLPIGESMPFTSVFPFLAKLDVGQAEWTPGDRPQPMTVTMDRGSFRFSGLICFESIFSHLARQSVRRGSQCLVVITNDGWFGESAGPRQHTELARLRAVETGVPVIRCANNGISFICAADGKILDRLDLGHRGVVRAEIKPGDGRTMYVAYGAWPLFAFLVVWSILVMVLGRLAGIAVKNEAP
ncbi:MAG: apolipoprotein N-acyltransferase [Candidatus Krumholzibacteria bacterium]|nr:apolipoprotein N-acyltransferase [Candidatus Krumholzibacteria bacterium]